MDFKRVNKNDICEIIVQCNENYGFQYYIDTDSHPIKVHFSFGSKGIPNLEEKEIEPLLNKLPAIQKISIPRYIPAEASHFISSLLSLGRDVNIYSQYEIQHPSLTNVQDGTTILPPTVFNQVIGDLNTVPDGFNEIKDVNDTQINDGFHELTEESVEPIKRELWTESPERMNRLSYTRVAAVRGETTFPDELGGGSI